jgi:thiamine kinase-like enzyme
MSITIEQIIAGYEDEKRNRRPPVTAEDVPFVYEDITPEWLTAVLCVNHPGTQVTSYRLDQPDEGNTSRRRIFLQYNLRGVRDGPPESVFCKASQPLPSRIGNGLSGAIQGEVNFYNKVRPSLQIEAPLCLFANYNAALNSIVILQDMGETATFCKHTTDMTLERAKSQMSLLGRLHGRFLDSPQLKTTLSIFKTWTEFFSMLDYHDFEVACDRALDIAGDAIPPRLLARRREIWPATQKSAQRHLDLPHTLCHGDVHLRNWYITADGRMGLNDWQAAHRGHWSRDVAYAMSTALTIENRRKWEDELLRFYHDELQREAGRAIPFDCVRDEVRRQLFTALAFWTITLNPAPGMPDMQPRDATLEFVRRIAAAVDDLDALDSFA